MRTLQDISLGTVDRTAVQRAAQALKKDFPVAQVVLFGSKARGQDTSGLDIDLLVLTSRAVTYPEKERMTQAVYPLELELGVVISLLIVSRDKWDAPLSRLLPIHAEIDRDGVAA